MKLSDYLCGDIGENGMPYCILAMTKSAIEHLFKLMGFFIALSLLVGLTLTTCPENILLQIFPLFVGFLFFLYIGITFFALPLFVLTDNIHQPFRKILRFCILGLVIFFALYSLIESPIFDLLVTYVGKLFPKALECHGGFLEL